MTTDHMHPAPPLSQRAFTLATDLDGTFLGGTEEDRARLYSWIEANRDSVGLIFVTGRDPGFITRMVRDRLMPQPDFVVGDVGTTIAQVDREAELHPIPDLEADIAERWRDSGARVRAALDNHPGLTLQPTDFRYRVSYDLVPDAFDPAAKTIVAEELGLDWLISANRYFDVLPRGVSKGPSLRRLIAHLGVPEARTLAAGDTLNDLSMLVSGLPAVAVGGSEAPLLERIADEPGIYRADAIGAAGILEAIAALGLHPSLTESNNVL